MKYLVRHWINVDMIAEEVIDGDGVDLKTNNIVGMYVGDNLYAKFDNNTESESMNKNNEQNLNKIT